MKGICTFGFKCCLLVLSCLERGTLVLWRVGDWSQMRVLLAQVEKCWAAAFASGVGELGHTDVTRHLWWVGECGRISLGKPSTEQNSISVRGGRSQGALQRWECSGWKVPGWIQGGERRHLKDSCPWYLVRAVTGRRVGERQQVMPMRDSWGGFPVAVWQRGSISGWPGGREGLTGNLGF